MVNFQCSQEEYDAIQALCQKTTCRSFSEYARKVLSATPVAVTCRDLSLDALIDIITGLRNKLERLLEPGYSKGVAVQLEATIQELKTIFNKIADQCMRNQY